MKAAQIQEYGGADAVKVTEIDKPTINDDQVLVAVHAASLNPFDTMVREGYLKDMIPLQLPATLGGDIAGEIVEIGENVTGFAVGDKVYGQANVVAGNSGAFAEFAATKPIQVAAIPSNIDMQQAASLALVGVSALQALTEHINLQSGQTIFIHGGSGGIGSIAIQIAKHLGATVATTATGEGIDLVKQLGADQVIDYKAQDFTAELHDVDAVFDTVGKGDFAKCITTVKKGGVAVSMSEQPDEAKAAELGITALNQGTQVTTEMLDKLRVLIESGVVTPRVGQVFSLEQVQEAFTARETGSVKGKIVLSITE